MDTKYITGPIPVMMEDCVDWVRRVTPTAIVADDATGVVRDRPTYPPVVVRELIANALIHGGPVIIAQLSAKTGRSEAQVRYSLAKLVSTGRLVREPGDGRTNVYRTVAP